MSRDGATVLRGPELDDLPTVDFVAVVQPAAPPARQGVWPFDPTASNGDEPNPAGEIDAAYQRGLSDGAMAAEAALADDARAAAAALRTAATEAETAAARQATVTVELAVDLALELTSLLLGREVATATDPGRDALVRALRETSTRGHLVIRLNPDDLARLDAGDALAGRSYELVADPAIRSGDAAVDGAGSRIDAGLGAALQRVAEVLRP